MNILVIGKHGQIGSSLILEAKRNYVHCIAIGRDVLDITNQEAVEFYFDQSHDFDFVINAAAYTNVDKAEKEPELAYSANCLAVKYLASSCRKYNLPFIHISTDYIFDGEKMMGYEEDDCPNPQNVYGQTKLQGENILKQTWGKYIILRVSWVFSEFGKNFLKTIHNLMREKDVISVVCDQFGSPTSAYSIAKVIIDICKQIHNKSKRENYWGVYHYSDFPLTNWHQFAKYIVQKSTNNNTKKQVLPILTKDYPTPVKRPKNSCLSSVKIKNVFGIDQGFWMNDVERL